ncbi:hypothetical protein L6164_026708 [Bauhinia variegata]|uniref:Uncharacterized protein n=1 Tax=Bauhinia variegata TaxID=167791 RepID=A0ACB9LR82_BAUVA|nr:hypothetical protein L6164_026708 [Bauhinia variegata]
MNKSLNFLHNIIKPFKFGSRREGNNEEEFGRIASQEQKVFSYETLASATKNFHPHQKLGEGGFGPVYKGKLDDGREIAVKKLSQLSKQGNKEFLNEAKLLARVQHRNVVNLLGYCVHGNEKLLVYEYVRNESLDKLLFKSNRKKELLDWKRRFDIIGGIAKDQTHANTRVAGTNGYMAPEYIMRGHLSVKADVFSFGVVMLELISGQRNSSFSLQVDAQNLIDWAYKLYKKGRSMEMVDPSLASSAVADQVAMCIQLGLLCTQGDPNLRPTMRRVVVILSKKPGHMEEPTRPAMPGSRYRRFPGTSAISSTPGTSGESDSNSQTFDSSNNYSTTATRTRTRTRTGTTSANPELGDPRGKRPM